MLFNPHLYKSLPYDPHADFEPISLLAFVDHVVIMHRSVPANSFHELVEYSKKHPDELNYGSNGFGGDLHLQIEWLKKKNRGKTDAHPVSGRRTGVIGAGSRADPRHDVDAGYRCVGRKGQKG
jgi:tripartite-type tricarboxylate transporter receptor subunit TctC